MSQLSTQKVETKTVHGFMCETAAQMDELLSKLRIIYSKITNQTNFIIQDQSYQLSVLLNTLHSYETTLESLSAACKKVSGNSSQLAVQVSTVLDIFPEFLEILVKYNKKYHKAWLKIIEDRKNNTELDDFLTKIEKDNDFSIFTTLFAPIFRASTLISWMQNLMKLCPQNVIEEAGVDSCTSLVMSEITRMQVLFDEIDEAISINQYENEVENAFAKKNIPRRLFCTIDCIKFSRKTQDPRTILLFSDALVVAEKSQNKFKNIKVYNAGDFIIAPIQDVDVFKNAIDIVTNDKSFRANCKTPEDKKLVIDAFSKVEMFQRAKTKAIDVSSLAPVWIPDELVKSCQVCSKNFSMFTRRHHCRVCGACICSNCAKKTALPQFEGKQELVCLDCLKKAQNTK